MVLRSIAPSFEPNRPRTQPPTTDDLKQRLKKDVNCKFIVTVAGCKAGDACPFKHPDPSSSSLIGNSLEVVSKQGFVKRSRRPKGKRAKPGADTEAACIIRQDDSSQATILPSELDPRTERRYIPTVNPELIIKPIPKSEASPRERQITQMKRRFGSELQEVDETHFIIPLVPSDPDFPFDLPILKLEFNVPSSYPREAVSIRVKDGLEVGFSRNLEREFGREDVGLGGKGRGILGMITWVDRNLERVLAMKKSETLKIVRPVVSTGKDVPGNIVSSTQFPRGDREGERDRDVQSRFSFLQIEEAEKRRTAELSALQARLKPKPVSINSFDIELSDGHTIRLHVPDLYPLESSSLVIVKGDKRIEGGANNALRHGGRELLRSMNWINTNLKTLALNAEATGRLDQDRPRGNYSMPAGSNEKSGTESGGVSGGSIDGFVPVAGQIYMVADDSGPDETSDSDSDSSNTPSHHSSSNASSDADDDNEIPTNEAINSTTQKTAERGTAINTTLTISNISLLTPVSISLTLKCIRCKSNTTHIPHLNHASSTRSTCTTCSAVLRVSFQGQVLHQGNSRMGYLELVGCTPVALGPSMFNPTCTNCDTQGPPITGLVSGQAQSRPCRACHTRQSVLINTLSFLILSSSKVSTTRGKTKREDLGIIKGTPLPGLGVCKHYRKSHRWFRFPCCSQIYACDICHDALSTPAHAYELARFQICGFCSRESSVRGEKPCVHCGREMTRKSAGSRYWEGGRGTRDQMRMSRNDPRKYRKKL